MTGTETETTIEWMSAAEPTAAIAEMQLRPRKVQEKKLRVGVGLIGLAFTLLLRTPCPAIASDDPSSWTRGRLTLRMTPEFSSGDYGENSDTEIWYVPFLVRYQFTEFPLTPYRHDRLALAVTIPYISIDGPGGVVGGTGGPIDIHGQGVGGGGMGGSTTASDESGLGDILLNVSYHAFPPRGSKLPWLTVSGKIKLPTASESKGLGTGETDYTLFSELYQSLGLGRVGLFAGAGYRFMGEPNGIDLNDRWLASAGVDAELVPALSVGLSYDYREAATSSSSAAHEISPWLGFQVSDDLRIEPYGIIGLSSASPDYGFGARLSWSRFTGSRDQTPDRRKLPPRTDQES